MKRSAFKGMYILIFTVLHISINAQGSKTYQSFDFLDFNIRVLTEHTINQENLDHLKSAVSRELQSKGLQQSSNPDLLVNIGVVVDEQVQTRETDYRDMRYMGQRNYHWEVTEMPVGVYKMGTVSIELVDSQENRVVWTASDRNVINKNPKKVQRKIDKGVTRIFRKFDPANL
ncbi:MAG: hypothetical protein DHS20C17_20400 [Cyclobacteriaceae bacterium]|nr:MAG: hypothetical protein DHS20C17_20400 [Cyclobacteriaceae bacterium]